MTDTNVVIAVYDNHSAAEDAVKELQKSGFDIKKLSVVGKDYHTNERVVGDYNSGDRMKYWGKWGAFWGGFWGLRPGDSAETRERRSSDHKCNFNHPAV